MTVSYPNLCYNEVCYKWTALYQSGNSMISFLSLFKNFDVT